ncbi:unnamed protein product [Caenorhabditis angaria]|uniref:Uncharacterized protein n=1 Tax=Caenorhabditis angaria TaxID=860376 RepID=A0A9P1ICB0_9PELO|nr:unnamed protein product [Caenorhabditis angaria]
MALFIFMTFSAIAVFFLLLIATCLPYTFLKNCCVNASKLTVSILGCASCGVFIATCFLGLVPHVRHQEMELRSNSTITSSYEYIPTTDQLVVIGFVIILIVEQLIHGIGHSIGHSHSSNNSSQPQTTIKLRKFLDEDGDDNVPLVDVDPADDDNDDIIFRQTPNSPGRSCHENNVANSMNIRVWFLLLGMSVHSFFEGVALGVQNDKHAFYQILIAVLFHEVLCCVSYGIQLAKHNASRNYAWISSIFLSATIPIGMVLATTIDGIENETWQRLGRYWLEGLAAGTFVHVALVELLPMELHSDEDGGHGHSHNLIADSTSSSHSHNHSSSSSSHSSKWSSLIKSLFVTGGILLFVFFKALIGTHH